MTLQTDNPFLTPEALRNQRERRTQPAPLPTEEEAFPLKTLPTAEEAFPTGGTTWTGAPIAGADPLHNYFLKGWHEQFDRPEGFADRPGKEGDPDTTWRKALERTGLLKDINDKNRSWIDTFNESLFIGLPSAVDVGFRAFNGVVYGLQQYDGAVLVSRKILTPAAAL